MAIVFIDNIGFKWYKNILSFERKLVIVTQL